MILALVKSFLFENFCEEMSNSPLTHRIFENLFVMYDDKRAQFFVLFWCPLLINKDLFLLLIFCFRMKFVDISWLNDILLEYKINNTLCFTPLVFTRLFHFTLSIFLQRRSRNLFNNFVIFLEIFFWVMLIWILWYEIGFFLNFCFIFFCTLMFFWSRIWIGLIKLFKLIPLIPNLNS